MGDLNKCTGSSRCVNCGAIFLTKLIKAKSCLNIDSINSNRNEKLILREDGFFDWKIDLEEGDCTPHCPICDHMHLNGFSSGNFDCSRCTSRHCNSCNLITKL